MIVSSGCITPIIKRVYVELPNVDYKNQKINLDVICDAKTSKPYNAYGREGCPLRVCGQYFWNRNFGQGQAERMVLLCKQAVKIWREELDVTKS